MPPNGAGSQRIVVLGEPRAPRDVPPPPAPSAKRRAHQANGWTPRRLTIAGALGASAVLAGGLVFLSKFGVMGANDSPFLAVGFGLFVIGMVVFCASLIALIGTGVGVLAESRGWPSAAITIFAPLALIWALYALGAIGYAIPAVCSLVLIGGLVVALK